MLKVFELTLGIILILSSFGVTIYTAFEYPLGTLFTKQWLRCLLLGMLSLALFLAGIFLIFVLHSITAL
jgi:hypothetical protein